MSRPVQPLEYANLYGHARSKSPSMDDATREVLLSQGYTHGLCDIAAAHQPCALRIWIVDNSGSMQHVDGQRLVVMPSNNNNNKRALKVVPCSRWEELQDSVAYHVQLASLLQAPTQFRFLNPPEWTSSGSDQQQPQVFGVGGPCLMDKKVVPELSADAALALVHSVHPSGCTPLTHHIRQINLQLSKMSEALQKAGQKVTITIATDGLPTNDQGISGPMHQRNFVSALRTLEGLPIWVVIRLCTDDAQVAQFYQQLDAELEFSVDVLDDFAAEAREIHQHNPWLTYGLPLHRLREMGCQHNHRLMDLLDERPLTTTQVKGMAVVLFGKDRMDGCPDPLLEYSAFTQFLRKLAKQEGPSWSVLKRKNVPWMEVGSIGLTGRRIFWNQTLRIVLVAILAVAMAIAFQKETF